MARLPAQSAQGGDRRSQFGVRIDDDRRFRARTLIQGLQEDPTPAFSLGGSRAVSAFSLATGGFALEQFAAEYGAHQFELASPPADALAAADQAVFTREVIRDAARMRGLKATFIPKTDRGLPGSGVHIHFSLWRTDGSPATARGGRLTPEAGSFAEASIRFCPRRIDAEGWNRLAGISSR
ncbi:hypothetical protein NKI79_30775 [Mesorhizobium sp. M0340]